MTVTFQITYKVDRVVSGIFSADHLTFCCNDESPTPESGIMLKGKVLPFRNGASGYFYLQHQDIGDCIVGYDFGATK